MADNTPTAEQAAEQSSIDKAKVSIAKAVEGYKAKYPSASEDELKDFEAAVATKIALRYNQKLTVTSDRRERIVAVTARVKDLGVRLATTRYAALVPSMSENRYEISPRGGLTAAYTYDEAGNSTTIALSICNETDVFDRLSGRERSVERYSKGITLVRGGRITDVDPLSLREDYLQLLRDKGISPQQQRSS